jgi:hypothetical protein
MCGDQLDVLVENTAAETLPGESPLVPERQTGTQNKYASKNDHGDLENRCHCVGRLA